MTWIKTVSLEEDDALRRAVEAMSRLYPREYDEPVQATQGGAAGIVASHSLFPDVLYHAFSAFGALLSPELPLERRQHEMITTVVSVANRCKY